MGSKFCQHCGNPNLTPSRSAVGRAATPPLGQPPLPAPPSAPSAQAAAMAKTMAADMGSGGFDGRLPTPAAGMPQPPSGIPMVPPGTGPVFQPAPFVPPPGPAAAPRSPTPAATPRAEPAYGRLVAVNRDGSDGQSFPLTGDQIDLGRSEAALTFPEDLYLAPRHARFEKRSGKVLVKPLDDVNGVFARVKDPVPLHSGDRVLLGKEVFRFEEVGQDERDIKPARQNGTLVFGTPPRAPWGRLSQIITSGVTRDVYHLSKMEVVLGREEGDITFPDDEFMSRRHAVVANASGKFELRDNGSSNGTYIRVRGDRELKSGDLLRMGDQLFRFELT